jgi:hypothetical protein
MKFTTVMTEMQEGDRVSSKNDEELASKYGIALRPSDNTKSSIDYYSNLYLYDTIIELVQPIDPNVCEPLDRVNSLGFSQRWSALCHKFIHSPAFLARPGDGRSLFENIEP